MRRAIPIDVPISYMINYTTPDNLEQFLVGACGLEKEKINIHPLSDDVESVVVGCILRVEHDNPARYPPRFFHIGCGDMILFHPEEKNIEVMSYFDFRKQYVTI